MKNIVVEREKHPSNIYLLSFWTVADFLLEKGVLYLTHFDLSGDVHKGTFLLGSNNACKLAEEFVDRYIYATGYCGKGLIKILGADYSYTAQEKDLYFKWLRDELKQQREWL